VVLIYDKHLRTAKQNQPMSAAVTNGRWVEDRILWQSKARAASKNNALPLIIVCFGWSPGKSSSSQYSCDFWVGRAICWMRIRYVQE
jgi:hypothetical protein